MDARFEVLRAVMLNIQVFWDVTACRLVNSYRRFEVTAILRNVGNYMHVNTASHSRRLKFSVKGVFVNQVLRIVGQNWLRLAFVKSSFSESYRECGLHFC
jgi:hypothetical protein